MANHRMFSNRIANSAKFLQMPIESQLLYFHMILRADDDGVVESYPLMKLLGIAPDNFKVLMAKKFIRELNEDQVVIIMDWKEHNVIRADRKINSIYIDLIKQICPDVPLLEPKPRSDVENNTKRLNSGPSTDDIRQDKGREGKIGKNKIKKDKDINIFGTSCQVNYGVRESLVNLPLVENGKKEMAVDIFKVGKYESPADPKLNEAIELFRPILPGDFVGNKSALVKIPTREAITALMTRYTLDQLAELIWRFNECKYDEYCPQVGTVYEFATSKLAKIEKFVALSESCRDHWNSSKKLTVEKIKVQEEEYRQMVKDGERAYEELMGKQQSVK